MSDNARLVLFASLIGFLLVGAMYLGYRWIERVDPEWADVMRKTSMGVVVIQVKP
jgi:hypothetical protein